VRVISVSIIPHNSVQYTISLTAEYMPGPDVQCSSIVATAVMKKADGMVPTASVQPMSTVHNPSV